MGGLHEEQVEIIDPWYGKAGGITRPLNLYQVSANARFSVGQSKEGVHLFSLTSKLEEVKFMEGHQLVQERYTRKKCNKFATHKDERVYIWDGDGHLISDFDASEPGQLEANSCFVLRDSTFVMASPGNGLYIYNALSGDLLVKSEQVINNRYIFQNPSGT